MKIKWIMFSLSWIWNTYTYIYVKQRGFSSEFKPRATQALQEGVSGGAAGTIELHFAPRNWSKRSKVTRARGTETNHKQTFATDWLIDQVYRLFDCFCQIRLLQHHLVSSEYLSHPSHRLLRHTRDVKFRTIYDTESINSSAPTVKLQPIFYVSLH